MISKKHHKIIRKTLNKIKKFDVYCDLNDSSEEKENEYENEEDCSSISFLVIIQLFICGF